MCITSAAIVKKLDTEEVMVKTTKAKGNKCPVCWKINKEKCEETSGICIMNKTSLSPYYTQIILIHILD